MIATKPNHPEPEVLADFARGCLSDGEAETLASHVAECATCAAVVANPPPDRVLGLLREALRAAMPPSIAEATVAPDSSVLPVPGELQRHSKYEVLELLGAGGMGLVFQARHRVMGRRVALKVIQQDRLTPQTKARFFREAEALSKLDHPNIVRFHDMEPLGDFFVVVMEYLEGESLAAVAQRGGRLPVALTCRYILQAARGLACAHDHGLIHRDIKPDNLRLAGDGNIKIVDFGLVRALDDGDSSRDLTGENVILGTPKYMAPEQAVDPAGASAQADLYALGCVFFHLLTGRPPFQDGKMFQVLLAQAHQEPPALRQWRDDVPPPLEALLRRLLAKDPKDRPQTAREVIAALEPFAGPEGAQQAERESTGPMGTALLRLRRTARMPRWLLAGVLLLAGTLVLWASGILRVRTSEGMLVVDVNEADAEVYVDGTKVAVTWDKGGKRAEIRVKPGTRLVEVKKDGFVAHGEQVALSEGGRKIVAARLEKAAPDKDWPKTPDDGFVSLFNGKDLQGWKTHPSEPNNWKVADGMLIGFGPQATALFSEGDDYTDFHARLLIRPTGPGSHGLAFRFTYGPLLETGFRGYQAFLHCVRDETVKASLGFHNFKRPETRHCDTGVPAQHWLRFEVIARDNKVRILVNGKEQLQYPDPKVLFARGHIALFIVNGAGLEVRKIEIRDLTKQVPKAKTPPPVD